MSWTFQVTTRKISQEEEDRVAAAKLIEESRDGNSVQTVEEKPEEMMAVPKGTKGAKVTKEAAVDTFIEAVASEAAAQPRPKLETIHSIPDAEAEPPLPNR